MRRRLIIKLITFCWFCRRQSERRRARAHVGENFLHDPITGFIAAHAIISSLIFSALSTGASLLAQRFLTPRPQGQVRGKLTGDITLTDAIWGAPLLRLYGGRPEGDNAGGVEVGTNVFWASDIRAIRTTVPGSGGGGGHKGGPAPPPDIQITYKIDFAAAIADGRCGRYKLLRLKANEDVLYNVIGTGGPPNPTGSTFFEAEALTNTLSGGAVRADDADCSGGKKVTGIGEGGVLVFNGIPDSGRVTPISIYYKAETDVTCYIKIDGVGGIYSFLATGGVVGIKNITRNLSTTPSPHTIEFSNPDAPGPEIDRIQVFEPVIIDPPNPTQTRLGPTGVLDENFPAEDAQDNILLPDPRLEDTNPQERYNRNAESDPDDGTLTITLSDGSELTFYEGNDHQPIDPVIAADISQKFGANYCPAFLEVSYIRARNFDISKWGSFPNLRVLVENIDTQMAEEILIKESSFAGLQPSDLDLSAAAGAHSRGYIVDPQQGAAPSRVFEDLGMLFNFLFSESVDGQIVAIDKSDRTPVVTLTNDDLAAYLPDSTQEPPSDLFRSTLPDESEMTQTLELQFNNPLTPSDYQTDRRQDIYPFTTSNRSKSISVPATLHPDEAQNTVKRLLQEEWLKAEPLSFSLPHSFAWLDTGKVLNFPVGGRTKRVRLEEKNGSAPGIYECTATDDELFVIAGSTAPATFASAKAVVVPANTVGTLMSIPQLEDAQNKPGIYAAATPKDPHSGSWRGCGVYRLKGVGEQRMATFDRPCTMGRAVTVLPDVPVGWTEGAWDDTLSVTVDFFGDQTPESVTDEQARDGANVYVSGNEVLIIATWTRDNSEPNRWVGTHMLRRLKGTGASESSSHVMHERVVFLNNAVRFIPLDENEKDQARTWKFVTEGQDIAHAAVINVAWGGETIVASRFNRYGQKITSGAKPSISVESYAGTGASANIPDNSNDSDGTIHFVTGTGASAGPQFTVVFGGGKVGSSIVVILTPRNAAAAAALPDLYYIETGSGFTYRTDNSLDSGEVYEWGYDITQIM